MRRKTIALFLVAVFILGISFSNTYSITKQPTSKKKPIKKVTVKTLIKKTAPAKKTTVKPKVSTKAPIKVNNKKPISKATETITSSPADTNATFVADTKDDDNNNSSIKPSDSAVEPKINETTQAAIETTQSTINTSTNAPTNIENKPQVKPEVANFVSTDAEYAYSIIKEITNDKYKGRKSGTEGYNQVANYIAQQYKNLGLKPVGDNKTYLQSYNLTMAELNSIPTLVINDKPFKYMEDFKIHSNSSSGNISGNEIVFVGYGYEEDFRGVDVSGKVVMFLCDPKPNAKAMGILDRALLAKSIGAVATLIVSSEYSPLKDYEHIVNGNNLNTLSFYVSPDAAKSIGAKLDTPKVQVIKAKVEGSIDIARTPATSSNVLGMIEGRNTSKTIVISANLDGFGVSPDGTIYQGAGMNASGVGTVLALAKYYSEQSTKPLYNILFTLFGSKAQALEGSKYFVSSYSDIDKVIANFNVYDVGSDVNMYIAAAPKSDSTIFQSVSKIITATEDSNSTFLNLGFMDVSSFKARNIPSMWLRSSVSETDSSKDTIETIKRETLTQSIIYMKEIVGDYQANTLKATFVPSNVTTELNADINKNLFVYETEHYKFYYEEPFSTVISEVVNVSEIIYENVMWWNYYPTVNQKIRVYLVTGYEDSARVVHRTDKYGQNEGNQGVQQPKELSLSIVSGAAGAKVVTDDVIGVLAHELNHDLASQKEFNANKQLSSKDTDNQEIHGRVYPYTVSSLDSKFMFKSFIADELNDISTINWDDYTGDNYLRTTKISMDEWRQYAIRMSTFEYFIWQKYGRDTARSMEYDFYNNDKISFKEVLAMEKLDFSSIIKDWKDWYENGSVNGGVNSGTDAAPTTSQVFSRSGTSKIVEITKFQKNNPVIKNLSGLSLIVDDKNIQASFELTKFNTIVIFADGLEGKVNFKVIIKPNTITLDGKLNVNEIVIQN